MHKWTARPATWDDVEPVAELRASVLRNDLERLGRYDDDRVRQRLRDGFQPIHTRILEVAGSFVGCIAVRPAADGHWIEHFYIDQRHQGQGVGADVLRQELARADRASLVMRLNVLQGSPARRLYERHGFVVDAEDPNDVFMTRSPTATLKHS